MINHIAEPGTKDDLMTVFECWCSNSFPRACDWPSTVVIAVQRPVSPVRKQSIVLGEEAGERLVDAFEMFRIGNL